MVNDYYPSVGGVQIQTKILAEGLVSKGHENIVLTKRHDPQLSKEEWINGVRVIRAICPSKSKKFSMKMMGVLLNCHILLRMRRKYQLIHLKAPYLEFLIPCFLPRDSFVKRLYTRYRQQMN